MVVIEASQTSALRPNLNKAVEDHSKCALPCTPTAWLDVASFFIPPSCSWFLRGRDLEIRRYSTRVYVVIGLRVAFLRSSFGIHLVCAKHPLLAQLVDPVKACR